MIWLGALACVISAFAIGYFSSGEVRPRVGVPSDGLWESQAEHVRMYGDAKPLTEYQTGAALTWD